MTMVKNWLFGAVLCLALPTLAGAQDVDPRPALPPQPTVQPVTDQMQVRGIEQQFQRQLDRLGGVAKITRCGPVLNLLTPQASGFDRGYGAQCDVQITDRTLQVLMCDDQRGGRFALTLAAVADIDVMRRFIEDNCFPAG